MARPFHLAFPVNNLAAAIDFYHRILGCPIGRQARAWADFDFFGNQITAHVSASGSLPASTNTVDGDKVPVRHFGAILDLDEWQTLIDTLKKENVEFILQPKTRFKGRAGEQRTFFVRDPAGNALEFKTFKAPAMVFETGGRDDEQG